MRINEAEVTRLADRIVDAVLRQGYVHPKVTRAELKRRVAEVLLEDLRTEQALEEEAERLADRHAREMAGLDRRKVVQGIKARLAKERGFTL